jgi:aerobic carbon-monoxide dehydrogenase large subunit
MSMGPTTGTVGGGSGRHVGRRLPRVEDRELITGRGRYVADISVPDCLEAMFVRASEAHGVLQGVDLSSAGRFRRVVAAYAAPDLPDLPPTPASRSPWAPPEMARPALARDRVRFSGEPVAVIVAEDRASAEDAVELAVVRVDPLPPVLDPTEAATDDGVRLFGGRPNVTWETSYGEEASEAFAGAPIVIELSLRNGRVAPVSIEPRGILVEPAAGGGLTVWCSHQAPHRLRDDLAGAVGLERDAVRVVAPNVGGAFGAKSQTYPEYLVVTHLAMKLGRPVRWIEGRTEAFVGATHGRGQNQRLRLAADRDGRVLAVEAHIDADLGAYPQTGGAIPTFTAWVMSGPYRIPQLFVRVRTVVTNAPPTASYRGAGRPEAAFGLERLMDELARAVDLDPAEVRFRNFIPPQDFPYLSPTGAVYDSGRYGDALRLALDLAGYDRLRQEQRRDRSESSRRLIGIGIGSFVERSGGQVEATEFGSVEVNEDGSVVARTGASSQGQGHRTAFAQIVADALDVDPSLIGVVQGDTSLVPEGTGTFGSRSVQIGGAALHLAARRVLDEARRRAADALEAAAEDLRYAGGRFSVAGSPETGRTLGEIVRDGGPLVHAERFESAQAFPFGSYVAVVEIDRETGDIDVTRLVAVDDCGVAINPLLAEGQAMGSIVQGLGQALYEGVVHDETGQPLTASLLSYAVPTTSELTDIVLGSTVTANPNGPLGAKGAGEAGCIGMPPAIVNAIHDALRGYDVAGLDMPVTPEKVWRALRRPLS